LTNSLEVENTTDFVKYVEPSLLDSVGVTYKMMFREEWRQSIDFAKKRHVLLFPALLALFSMLVTLGFPFLVGEGVPNSINPVNENRAFSWDEMKQALHVPLFMFSLGMGSFAFLGRVMISQRAGGLNYLLAAPALQPLRQSVNYFSYYLKEVTFYILFVLIPVVIGMGIAIFATSQTGLFPIKTSSLYVTLIAMVLTLSQGLAFSFLGSALWTRGRYLSRIIPLFAIGSALVFALGYIPFEYLIIGLKWQYSHELRWIPLGLMTSIFLALLGSFLVSDDFEHQIIEREELFLPIHNKLSFLDWGPIGWLTFGILRKRRKNTKLRLLVTKEIVELIRSGTVKKMIVSYSIPLAVLLLLAWAVDFTEAPIPVNLLSYAPFLGFFGFNFYSWLTVIDSPAHYDGLPVNVPEVIRAKVAVYFLSTTWISIIFLILMAWNLDAWWTLPGAFIVMIANSIYIVALTAFLMGLKPNKAIFDASIMFWFWIGTVIPLLLLFVLSFTQGDTAIIQNWAETISAEGINANSTGPLDVSVETRAGFGAIFAISAGITLLGAGLLRLIDIKWGKHNFEN
jgi:hypothetical protein